MTTSLDGSAGDAATSHHEDALKPAIDALARGEWTELESTLVDHGGPMLLPGTKATLRLHYLRSDASGRVRLKALAEQLAKQVILFCIPRSRFEEAHSAPKHLQAQAFSELHMDALRLFATGRATGEGAELLLYSLLEKKLGIPQILSKMNFKTDTQMHVHGSDGVHAKLLPNGDLALYWGEAKLHATASETIKSCFTSLAPFLLGETDDEDQDVYLLRHYVDTGHEETTERLLEYWNNDSIKSANIEVRGACLVGFSVTDYPKLPREIEAFRRSIDAAVDRWSKAMGSRITEAKIEQFELEIFCVPVPSAEDFRLAVRRALGIREVT